MSVLTQTNIPEDGKTGRSPPSPLLALEPEKLCVLQPSDTSLVGFMTLWGFSDCPFNCLLSGVDKHIVICKKRGLITATRPPIFCSLNLFREASPPRSRAPADPANSGLLPIARSCESPLWETLLRQGEPSCCKRLAQIHSFSLKILLLRHLPAD